MFLDNTNAAFVSTENYVAWTVKSVTAIQNNHPFPNCQAKKSWWTDFYIKGFKYQNGLSYCRILVKINCFFLFTLSWKKETKSHHKQLSLLISLFQAHIITQWRKSSRYLQQERRMSSVWRRGDRYRCLWIPWKLSQPSHYSYRQCAEKPYQHRDKSIYLLWMWVYTCMYDSVCIFTTCLLLYLYVCYQSSQFATCPGLSFIYVA